ncbi:hypothetical protein ACJJTC_005009 [Scirpophaga incertulas]
MVNCAACGRFLSTIGAAVCTSCPMMYHKACVACPDKAQLCKGWICPNCKRGVRKGDNTLTPVKSVCEDIVVDSVSVETAGTPPRKEVESEGNSDTALGSKLPGVADFRQSSWRAWRRYREGTSVSMANLERTVAELKTELNDRDQEGLLADLDISCLPEEKNENTLQAVTVLAGRLGVTLDERDVVFAERVGTTPVSGDAGVRPRRVVVRLARRRMRDELLRAARVRRTVAATGGARVYINERLTRPNRLLFHHVREECRRLQWRYFWTKRGRVYARQGDGKPAFPFRSAADLERVFGPRPTP